MGTPKALLTFAGETFLDRLIGIFEPVCSKVVVVLGHSGDTIRAGLSRTAEFAVNPDPERGQLSSLQCGFHALHQDHGAVFFTPVDYPGIRPETVAAIQSAMKVGDAAVVPAYRGRHGHPVLIAPQLVSEFLDLGISATARDVMHRHTERTRYIEVDDPGILLDVDDPEAYRALTHVAF
jgi:molybdenum cofactor cytidylyltransferase